MITLIFSDTHLTTRFNEKQFQKLRQIINKADQVIINGDFFDGFLTSFDQFCESQWSKLFPDLKSKHTIYILGNHDKPEFLNKKVKLFSTKVLDEFEFKSGSNKFIVHHGHHLSPSIEKRIKFISGWHNNYQLARFIYSVYELSKSFSINLVGTRFYYSYFNRLQTESLRKWAKKNLPQNEFLIAGHTHYQVFDPKNHFIGVGVVNYNLCQYALINNGQINLYSEKY